MRTFFLLAISILPQQMVSQNATAFTRADTLRGMLSPLRSCYDVSFYHLDIRIEPEEKLIRGSNLIRFEAVTRFQEMQVDLFGNMQIDRIEFDGGGALDFRREHGAVFISLPSPVDKGEEHAVKVFYEGRPVSAERPPWSGGFIWTQDEEEAPWVAVACQGTGASLWWPNKDHQSDEPDSMMISVTVPPGLRNVSNGRLRARTILDDQWERYDWFVANPINNYNVTINVARFDHFSDEYTGGGKTLSLDYYVLPRNRTKAEEQFSQVDSTLVLFERFFGEYPFVDDGFKLIESPYLGMEHQSAIAYGNSYMNGYSGTAQSAVGPSSRIGLGFDFIIIHEAAHEWWGNSVTAKDVADLWIHESFAAYAEALYVEGRWGEDVALDYINAKRTSILNDRPIIGTHEVQNAGSKDMYNKGQIVLNTLRSVVDNDSLWFSILYDLPVHFRHQIVEGRQIFGFINDRVEEDLGYFFDQYFRHASVPVLEAYIREQGGTVTLEYRWNADVESFRMPVGVRTGRSGGGFEVIRPTTAWQEMELGDLDPRDFMIDENRYYAGLKLGWVYLDSRKEGTSYIRR